MSAVCFLWTRSNKEIYKKSKLKTREKKDIITGSSIGSDQKEKMVTNLARSSGGSSLSHFLAQIRW
jgi:hypothetical protein